MEDIYSYPQAVNLAISMTCERFPPYNEKLLDMYWNDAKKIKLSEAIRYSQFLSLCPQNNTNHNPPYSSQAIPSYTYEIYYDSKPNNNVLLAGKKVKYTETKFSEFDEFLVNQMHYKFK